MTVEESVYHIMEDNQVIKENIEILTDNVVTLNNNFEVVANNIQNMLGFGFFCFILIIVYQLFNMFFKRV